MYRIQSSDIDDSFKGVVVSEDDYPSPYTNICAAPRGCYRFLLIDSNYGVLE
jgi:hypothetical protein